MSLEIPELDDRTYADLVAAAVERIPVHTDEWSDHNAHDPGITVLETLAWIAESYGYRLDQVTERHVRKYLALVGVTPHEPVPATVRVRLVSPDMGGRRLPAGTRLVAEEGTTERAFTTTRATTLTAASIVRVVVAHDRGRTDYTTANATESLQFPAFGENATVGSSLYVGFDADPFKSTDEQAPFDLHLDYHDADLPSPADHGDEPVRFEPSVALAWEYCTNHEQWYDDGNWKPMDVIEDSTRLLYQSGTVTLGPPGDDWDLTGTAPPAIFDGPPGSVWLRCRLVTPGYEVPPRLDRVTVGVLYATHGEHRGPTILRPVGRDGATATARPGQTFAFDGAPVLDAAVVVETADGSRTQWTEMSDFDVSGPDDAHYVRDATTGTVTFGDGRHGAIPPAGATVVAERYTVGGGTAGNVAANARWWVAEVPADPTDETEPLPETVREGLADTMLTPLVSASGGRDAETVAAALRRAREDQRTPYRCVTLADYETVAAYTPGLRVARATAWVETGPDDPPDPTVHVVVVPYTVGTRRPVPSDGFLAAVRTHVDRYRLVTDRVRVEPPTYVPVRVGIEVRAVPGHVPTDVERAIEGTLDGFLDPLSGFDGEGWPFGRPLYLSEVYDVVADVSGVDHVLNVTVHADVTTTSEADGAVTIPSAALFDAGEHAVTVRTAGRRWSS